MPRFFSIALVNTPFVPCVDCGNGFEETMKVWDKWRYVLCCERCSDLRTLARLTASEKVEAVWKKTMG